MGVSEGTSMSCTNEPGHRRRVRVTYWLGTMRCEAFATTYRGAMRIALRNSNAYGQRFYDDDGQRLYDDGHGLAYEDRDGYYMLG